MIDWLRSLELYELETLIIVVGIPIILIIVFAIIFLGLYITILILRFIEWIK